MSTTSPETANIVLANIANYEMPIYDDAYDAESGGNEYVTFGFDDNMFYSIGGDWTDLSAGMLFYRL